MFLRPPLDTPFGWHLLLTSIVLRKAFLSLGDSLLVFFFKILNACSEGGHDVRLTGTHNDRLVDIKCGVFTEKRGRTSRTWHPFLSFLRGSENSRNADVVVANFNESSGITVFLFSNPCRARKHLSLQPLSSPHICPHRRLSTALFLLQDRRVSGLPFSVFHTDTLLSPVRELTSPVHEADLAKNSSGQVTASTHSDYSDDGGVHSARERGEKCVFGAFVCWRYIFINVGDLMFLIKDPCGR